MRTLGITSAIRVHVGHGGVHLYPFLNLNDPSLAAFLRQLADHYHQLVRQFSGNIQSEHGIGFSRTPFLHSYIDAPTSQLFRQIKRLFDPQGILNPKKLTTDRSNLELGSFLRKPAIPEDLLRLERLGSLDSLQRLDAQLEREKQRYSSPSVRFHHQESNFLDGHGMDAINTSSRPTHDVQTSHASSQDVPFTHSPSTTTSRISFAERLASELAKDFSVSSTDHPASQTAHRSSETIPPSSSTLSPTLPATCVTQEPVSLESSSSQPSHDSNKRLLESPSALHQVNVPTPSTLSPPSSTAPSTASLTSQMERTASDIESESEETLRDLFELQVDWKPEEMVEYVRPCNGCGDCRARVSEMRTCPIFRVNPQEQASPRAKINLIRGILSGQLPREIITEQACRELADLCISCHACSVECPAQVQVAKMMSELRGAYVAANGLSFQEWFVCRLDLWCNFASRLSPFTRNILRHSRFRWLLEKLAGIARNRRLPKISSQPFLRRAARRGLTRWSRHSETRFLIQDPASRHLQRSTSTSTHTVPTLSTDVVQPLESQNPSTQDVTRTILSTHPAMDSVSNVSCVDSAISSPRVVYFVDLFANYHDPSVAEALVSILNHHQIPVYVPANQTQSGNAAIRCGALDLARSFARRNVQALVDAVRQGYTILASDPSAVLALRQEYPMLLPDEEDVHLVANATQDASSFLRELHRQGQLRTDFHPIPHSIGYYQPCRLLALDEGVPDLDLLRLIPELKVQRIVAGCCGMASAYGLRAIHFRESLRIGRNLASVLRDASFTWVATSCGSCRMQIEQISDKSTCHPLRILATAYGLQTDFKTPLLAAREKHSRFE